MTDADVHALITRTGAARGLTADQISFAIEWSAGARLSDADGQPDAERVFEYVSIIGGHGPTTTTDGPAAARRGPSATAHGSGFGVPSNMSGGVAGGAYPQAAEQLAKRFGPQQPTERQQDVRDAAAGHARARTTPHPEAVKRFGDRARSNVNDDRHPIP